MIERNYNSNLPIIQQFSAALVIGLGNTGYSVVRYLSQRGLKIKVIDSRIEPPMLNQLKEQYPEVECVFGSFDSAPEEKNLLVVLSPGIALHEPYIRKLKKLGAHIVGDVELFIEENTKPLIAITGSNGKSTVTTLVGEMCLAAGCVPLVAGNIGLPVLDALTDNINYDVGVLELSSFQLETTSSIQADSATILNVSADHMDRYESMGDYTLAKARVLRGAKCVVLPRHDELLQQITHNSTHFLSFDLDEPANDNEYGVSRIANSRWLVKGSQKILRLAEVRLTGLHNIKNVLAAFALLEFLNLPLEKLIDAVKAFLGLPHRMQTVLAHQGVTWVNDSKATNVGATKTALLSLEKDIVWIAGGQGKGADFNELKDAIGKKIQVLVLMGEDADAMESALKDCLPILRVADMHSAVKKALEQVKEQSIVLLSPACASFDMYDNFEQRGDDFASQVRTLTGEGEA